MSNDERAHHAPLIPGSTVFDAEGQQAQVVATDNAGQEEHVVLQRPHGRQLKVPQHMLALQEGGAYLLPFAFADLDEMAGSSDTSRVIPVLREELQVGKRVVGTGRGIRVRRRIVERAEVVDEPLRQDMLEVTHVPIDRIIDSDTVPAPRQEGETLIVPVLEEVLVIDRKLRLKEELHITRRQREVHAPQTVILKSQQISIERFDEKPESGGTPAI